MGVQFMVKGDRLVALLSGEIDHHTAAGLREEIDRKAEQVKPKVLALDFSKVGFMDSSGIGLVMGRYRLMESLGGRLHIWNLSPQMERIVSLSGVSKLVIIEKVKIQEEEPAPPQEEAPKEAEEAPIPEPEPQPEKEEEPQDKPPVEEYDSSRDIFSDSSKEGKRHEQK